MRLNSVQIRNFRKLSDVSMKLDHDLTAIVGPNAMGKTSVLEAIRLCKSLLMPRTHDESQQVLIALGAASPHIMFGPFQYDFASFAGSTDKPVEIILTLTLSKDEIGILRAHAGQVTQGIISSELGQQNQSHLGLIQYLSSEKGQEHQGQVIGAVNSRLGELEKQGTIELNLQITPTQIHGDNLMDQSLASALEALTEPAKAIFSYFPADRSLPIGEVAVQLHSGDMKAHVDSHFASAANKYPRLKQVIVNQLIVAGQTKLESEFDLIFKNLLPGKRFKGIEQKPTGTVSVRIQDIDSGHIFDLDSMSSGEKGLILTYLLLRTSLAKGGIVLIDEPELHLNPAVCRKLLDFLNDHICKPLGAQVLLCTHSPEILSQAFERDDFGLYELLKPDSMNPLFREDKEEMYCALNRLGVSASDSLVAKGFVFVEGDDDVALYEKGFPEILQGFKTIQKKGRKEVEKEIGILQQSENEGKLDKIHLFIFDNDRKPVSHKSSKYVKIVQLDRYCIENYLLDDRYIYNLLRDYASIKPQSRAELTNEIKQAALSQLKPIAALEAYGDLQSQSCGIRSSKIKDKDYPAIANTLRAQLEVVQSTLNGLNLSGWEGDFVVRCNDIEDNMRDSWEAEYLSIASGKLIFDYLQKKYQINQSPIRTKLALMEQLAKAKTETWIEINGLLSANLSAS